MLPFANVSGDTANEYFSDGITEDIMSALAQLPELRVVARTSSFALKGKNLPVDSIARALRVAHVLEGSVRKAGDRVRSTARLVDARTGFQLWSGRYDHVLTDIFAVEDEISRAIVDALRTRLPAGAGPPGSGALAAAPAVPGRTGDPEAHALYLKGRYLAVRLTRPALEQAVLYFRQAIERDPSYARAWAGLANAYASRMAQGFLSPEEALPEVERAARRALELDPALAEAHVALAGWRMTNRDWAGAEAALREAIERQPSSAAAHYDYSILLTVLGRHQDALREAERAYELEPLWPSAATNLAALRLGAGDVQGALELVRSVVETEPTYPWGHAWLGMALARQGDLAGARTHMRRPLDLLPPGTASHAIARAYLASVLLRAGDAAAARDILRELKATPRPYAFAVALVHGELAEPDSAFRWLEISPLDVFHLGIVRRGLVAPRLREDPRFSRYLRRIGLE